MKQFQILKENLKEIRILETKDSLPNEGEIVFRVDHFAFTSNNITYAVLGEKFKYWNFFPAEEGFGIIPTWGYGTIEASKNDKFKIGDRYYGYFPMASQLLMKPENTSKFGFVDASTHRAKLPSFYNYYEKIATCANLEFEYQAMLFNPLFATSFLLNEFFIENKFFGASNIVLTSASSKTAIALAYIVNRAKLKVKLIGFTSMANYKFVESLDIYDELYQYDAFSAFSKDSACIIDFAGNKSFMLELQNHLMPKLKFCSVVGLSHWEKQDQKVEYPFKPSLFFAPTYGAGKIKEWGMPEYKKRLNEQLHPFLKWTNSWLQINCISEDGVAKVYIDMLNGKVNPKQGIIMSLVE